MTCGWLLHGLATRSQTGRAIAPDITHHASTSALPSRAGPGRVSFTAMRQAVNEMWRADEPMALYGTE